MPSKDEIIDELKKYNTELLSKLESASEWMQRSVETKKKHLREKEQIDSGISLEIKKVFETFFYEIDFGGKKEDIYDDILSSEILYLHMLKNTEMDGTGIIIGYNKAVDITIEERIIQPFRKFARKKSENFLKSGRPDERLLYEVIYDGYTLSLGRIFHYLEALKQENIGFFVSILKDFLEEYFYIKEVVYNESFLGEVRKIIDKDYFGSKRHMGSVSLEEVREVRSVVMGNFKNKDCILYQLLKM